MVFVHSLVKHRKGKKMGWCAPVELGESSPHYISFVIPVDDASGAAFLRYTCEAVKIGKRGKKTIIPFDMVKEGNDSFVLKIENRELWFTLRPVSQQERRLPYIGKLNHADFAHAFTEIEPEDPARLDELCEEEAIFLIGCDPIEHYSGLKISGKPQRHVPSVP